MKNPKPPDNKSKHYNIRIDSISLKDLIKMMEDRGFDFDKVELELEYGFVVYEDVTVEENSRDWKQYYADVMKYHEWQSTVGVEKGELERQIRELQKKLEIINNQ